MTLRTNLCLLAAAATLGAATGARAQAIEVPILVMEAPEGPETPVDDKLNINQLVLTAAKGVTTVQEAPAIITILPGDELRDRGLRNMEEILDSIPGWTRYGAEYSQFPFVNTRGTIQAMLYLRDGVSMFDPMVNVATVSRIVPVETIKRIEVITGPGGVLWGANSYLGVVNVITKDAEDVNGVEASVGVGDGPGDRGVMRGYVMLGKSRLFSDKVKLFAHASFDTWVGAKWVLPNHMYSSPTPQPNSPDFYGPLVSGEPPRSMAFNFDGKLTLGPVNLYWFVPFIEKYTPLGFPGTVQREELPEDTALDPMTNELLCPPLDRNDPMAGTSDDQCIDRGRASRRNKIQFYDRYAILEYRTRFADNKAGLTFKGYGIQFVREFDPLVVLPPVKQLLEGGLTFAADFTNYRVGGALDGDVELPGNLRLLYGVEAFRDWLPSNIKQSRQGEGIEATFHGPYNEDLLPLPCPVKARWDTATMSPMDPVDVPDCPLTFAFATDRTVFGAFTAAQLRPFKGLILDGGVRAQVAPASLSTRPYDPVLLGSGAIVWEFVKNWHLKLNYTQGFRPPVFNNTDSNGEAVEFDGERDLTVERSEAFQAEVNARLLKGERRIRELNIRADYSYTILDNFISIFGGRYRNSGKRGIHSGELLSKLYLKGGHRMELGYTWLQINMADRGVYRASPEHWFQLGGVFSLVPDMLELHGTVKVNGAFEDPNRRVEARDLEFDPLTGHSSLSDPSQTVRVDVHELVLDRVPPSAEVILGVRWLIPKWRASISATAYNAFNALRYQPDAFFDYEPRLEFLPNPYEDFRFFANATVAY